MRIFNSKRYYYIGYHYQGANQHIGYITCSFKRHPSMSELINTVVNQLDGYIEEPINTDNIVITSYSLLTKSQYDALYPSNDIQTYLDET